MGKSDCPFQCGVLLIETSLLLSRLFFLFLIAKSSLDNSWLPCFYDQVYVPLGCFYLEVPGTICLIWHCLFYPKKFLEGFSITFQQNFCVFKVVSSFLDSVVNFIPFLNDSVPFKLSIRELFRKVSNWHLFDPAIFIRKFLC